MMRLRLVDRATSRGLAGILPAPVLLLLLASPARPAEVAAPDLPPPPPPILLDHTDFSSGGNAMFSQNYESKYDAYDCQAADDFTVSPGEVWMIERVKVLGHYSALGGPAQYVDVFFYADTPGLPDVEVYRRENVSVLIESGGDLTFDLPVAAALPAGSYWLSVRAHMDYDADGQWYWETRTAASGASWAWRNPGDGFGRDCTIWRSGVFCGGPNDSGLLFALYGESVGGACNGGAETFDVVPPDQWTVYNAMTPGVTWKTNTDWSMPNYTGGAGSAATVSSALYGAAAFDTELRSPPFGMVGETAAEVRYLLNYKNNGGFDRLDFEVSKDGFATSTTLLSLTTSVGTPDSTPGARVIIDLAPFVGKTGLLARWRYWDHRADALDYYVQIDAIDLYCGIFFDTFEGGDLSRWSASAP